MWTDPEHCKAWYGPAGADIPVAEMDVRIGGKRRVCMEMHTPNRPMRMWFTGEYREVVQNVLLVYTESMSDENGHVMSPSDMGMPEGQLAPISMRLSTPNPASATEWAVTARCRIRVGEAFRAVEVTVVEGVGTCRGLAEALACSRRSAASRCASRHWPTPDAQQFREALLGQRQNGRTRNRVRIG